MAGHGNASAKDSNAVGLYGLAAEDIMSKASTRGMRVCISFFEVYRGHVLDLLNQHSKLEVLEDGKGRVQECLYSPDLSSPTFPSSPQQGHLISKAVPT